MADVSPSSIGAVACPRCGFLDTGRFCSSCGGELSAPEHPSMVRQLWEHAVVERAQGAGAYLRTTWWIFARPTAFFRTAMQRPAQRAGHVLPSPRAGAAVVPLRAVYNPVKYLFISFLLTFLAAKLTGAEGEWQLAPGLPEELNAELLPLMMLTYIGTYSFAFKYTTGRRVSTGEAAVFNAYLSGALLFVLLLIMVTPEWMAPLLAGELLLLLFLVILPYVVFPRLYPITRGRLLLAQIGAGMGGYLLTVVAVVAVGLLVAAVAAALGIPL